MFEHLRDKNGQIPFIRKLCAHLDEHALRSAEASYLRYLTLVWTIAAETGAEPESRNGEDLL